MEKLQVLPSPNLLCAHLVSASPNLQAVATDQRASLLCHSWPGVAHSRVNLLSHTLHTPYPTGLIAKINGKAAPKHWTARWRTAADSDTHTGAKLQLSERGFQWEPPSFCFELY